MAHHHRLGNFPNRVPDEFLTHEKMILDSLKIVYPGARRTLSLNNMKQFRYEKRFPYELE